MNLRTASRIFFAVTMIAIAVMPVFGGTFAPIWQPVPATVPLRHLLAFLCLVVPLAAGLGLLMKRRGAEPPALLLFLYLAAWAIAFKAPVIVRHPLVEVAYQSCGENAVQIAGAWILYIWLANETGAARIGFLTGDRALRLARLLCGLAYIAFGFSHFAYLNLTAPLVPKWLPGPVFWAYLTGTVYLVSGVTLVTSFAARLGALLAAVQITLITLLVWGPYVLAGHISADNWQETVVSWAITAGAWVVAASFGASPWFGLAIYSRPKTAPPTAPSRRHR